MEKAVEAIEIFGVYRFSDIPFYRHDPKGFLKRYCSQHNISWAYTHCICLEEEVYKRAISLQEVESKIGRKRKASQRVNKPREIAHEDFLHGKYPL